MHRACPGFAERRAVRAAAVGSLFLAFVVVRPAPAQEQPDEPAPPTPAELVREGNSWFRSGEYREALKRYELARQLLPDRAEIAFNRGLTRMQLDQYAEAAAALNQALLSPDKEVEARAKFLLGNAHHRMALAAQEDPKTAINDLELATQYYADSLALNPANDDARANIELAQRLIRQLREMQQQQQQSGDGEQQEQQDQDEQQQDQQQQQQEQSDQQQQQQDGEKSEEQQQEEQQQQQGEESQEKQEEQQQSDQQGEQQQEQQQQDPPQQGEQSEEQQQKEQQQQEGQPQDAEQQEQQGGEGEGQSQADAVETQEQQISQEQAERLLQKVRDKERQRRLERMRQDTRRAPVKKDW